MAQTKPRITFRSPAEPRNRALIDERVQIEQLMGLDREEKG
jgi:hypothetical protein